MKHRLDLQSKLETILGSRNVYFQPPTGLQLKYPCIVYQLDNYVTANADNKKFIQYDHYSITVIDSDPESKIVEKVNELPMCSINQHFVSDNLYHSVFTIYC